MWSLWAFLSAGCFQRVFVDVPVEEISVLGIPLRGGVTYTFRTEGLEGMSPDTVMHVFRRDGVWMGSNDECSDPAAGLHGSCVTVTPRFGGWYNVVVHAYDGWMRSTGSVVVTGSDGTVRRYDNQRFGGTSFRSPDTEVGWTAGDEIVTVAPLEGPEAAVCLALVVPSAAGDRNAVEVAGVDVQGGWMGGCRVRLDRASDEREEGTRWLVVGAAPGKGQGRLNVYVNDRLNDHDGDTLGDDLERQARTCPGRPLYAACSSPFAVPNGMDTDGDGLHDDWELLGRPPSLPLPRWGADPRHKDAFIEVDNLADARMLTTADAEAIAAIYAAGPADKLRNPDLRDGIALHFDLGVGGCRPVIGGWSCTTTWGDWGGHSVIPAGTSWETVYDDPVYFADGRRGVFSQAIASRGTGGGRCCHGHSMVFGSSAPGGATLDALAHEWGHLVGFQHGGGDAVQGSLNCKPNYESLMNYAFGGVRKFSEGTRPPLNAVDLVERTGVGPDPSYMTGIWDIASDGDAIDWNRDWVVDLGGRHQYGYPMWVPGKSCGSLEYHRQIVEDAEAYPDKSPSVVAFDDKIWVFYWRNDGDDLGYVRFSPDPSLGGDLRRCGPPDQPWSECTVIEGPSSLPADLSSSPMFVHCPSCPAADGVDPDRLVGVYATGRGVWAQYRILSLDRMLRWREITLAAPRPATFANTSPYTDPREAAVADPAIARVPAWIVVMYRHWDGTLHQVLLDHRLQAEPDEQVTVGGSPVIASNLLGRDPALLFPNSVLYAFYVDAAGTVRQLHWDGGPRWVEDTGVFASPLLSVTQPGVATAGAGLPFAIRMEVRKPSGNPIAPFPKWREWTNPAGQFSWVDTGGAAHSNGAYVRNVWDADYRGATRLALFNGVEVAASVGWDPSPLFAAEPQNDPTGVCRDCDCHLGTRPDASGGRTACGHPDGWGTEDRSACNCPFARQIFFRPLADGVVDMTLLDFDDWSLPGARMCSILRPCTDCVPPDASCMVAAPTPCQLPPAGEQVLDQPSSTGHE
ncbi:MAG: hypothetical protein GYA57_01730 [Myxococcales bacterium]|nr:hypothetical protein [Myxococcales bacterium]